MEERPNHHPARPWLIPGLGVMAACLLLAGCGGTTAGRPVSDPSGQGAAASCAASVPAAQFANATAVIAGTMLPGPTVRAAGRKVLASPARLRVSRYLKGAGPPIVTVETAVAPTGTGARVKEDGIEPLAGQRWKVYATSRHMPYATSICAGSRALRGSG